MTRPRLIATDLDGTFLDPNGEVSPVNASAVLRAAELGVPFVVATGRPSRWLVRARSAEFSPTRR